ncbi:MAG: peptidase T [Bacilli bacterium]
MNLLNRFLKYVSLPTTSNPNSKTHPSSEQQKVLGRLLVEEMKALGISDAYMDDHSYVYGTLKSNSLKPIDTIGFIAHLDTSCDMSGENIKPRIIDHYDGGDVILNNNLHIKMSPKEFPFLADLKGQTLIVTDGTTLLGADDKAGIAEIMAMIEFFQQHQEIEHGDVKIAFTPDEEIGEGPMFFNIDNFSARWAYTVDGSKEGIINYENFNAASCVVTIKGINIHPGYAKDHMKNSLLIAMEFNQMLPEAMTPSHTDNYEGFYHLNNVNGDVETTTMQYIIRNHDQNLFENQKAQMEKIAHYLNDVYGEGTVFVSIKDQYLNMKEIVNKFPFILDIATQATKEASVDVAFHPIRGGTDGAQLTYRGLICPNLGTGSYNFHGRYECATVEAMEKCTEILINIVKLVAKKGKF